MTISQLSFVRLYREYSALRASASLGGSSQFYGLQRTAWLCFDGSAGEERLCAFVLASMFGYFAKEQDEEVVTADEAEQLFTILDQPIIQCLSALAANRTREQFGRVLTPLTDALAAIRIAKINFRK